MQRIQKGFRLSDITKKEYQRKELDANNQPTGKMVKEYRKVLHLDVMEQCPLTGTYLPSLRGGKQEDTLFPMRYTNGVFGSNPLFEAIEEFRLKFVRLAVVRLDTTPFNFPEDNPEQGPRTSLKVSVLYNDTESDEELENRLIQQAIYRTRELNVTFLENGTPMSYRPDWRKNVVAPAISTTAEQWAVVKAEAQAKSDKIKAELAKMALVPPTAEELEALQAKWNTGFEAALEEHLEEYEQQVRDANPTVKTKDLTKLLSKETATFKEEYLKANPIDAVNAA